MRLREPRPHSSAASLFAVKKPEGGLPASVCGDARARPSLLLALLGGFNSSGSDPVPPLSLFVLWFLTISPMWETLTTSSKVTVLSDLDCFV